MKKEPNKKAIGLFLIVGFLILFGLIGQSVWHKIVRDKKNVFVMYFDESIKGLSQGAPVVFRGVEIGKVIDIKLVADTENISFLVPVYIRIKPLGLAKEKNGWENLWNKQNIFENLIQRGLRARLATQSYLTGQLMIELVMSPESKINTVSQKGFSQFPQIPTILSKGETISKEFDSMEIQKTMAQVSHVMDVLNAQLPILLPALSDTTKTLNTTLEKVANNTDETIFNVNKALTDISDAARSVQNLADYLEQHPESLIKGKKGE